MERAQKASGGNADVHNTTASRPSASTVVTDASPTKAGTAGKGHSQTVGPSPTSLPCAKGSEHKGK